MDANGRIVESGTAEEIAARPGNILDLGKNAKNQAQENDAGSPILPTRRSDNEISSFAAVVPTTEFEADLSRQTGDSSVYVFYIRLAGWRASLSFLASMLIYAFCEAFPSKSKLAALRRLQLIMSSFRSLARMVG